MLKLFIILTIRFRLKKLENAMRNSQPGSLISSIINICIVNFCNIFEHSLIHLRASNY